MLSWASDHAFILVLFAAYALVLVRHAWEGHRSTRGIADYYVGGRRMGGVVIGLSFFATYSSTNSFVGFAGQGYAYGAPWLLLIPFVLFFSVLAWLVVAPRLHRFTTTLDSLTIPDFIGFRYGTTAGRVLAALLVLFASLFYLTAIFKGAGQTLESMLGVPYWLAIVMFLAIVVTYTAVGGFISVVRTDAFQALIMVAAAMVLFSGIVSHAGGLASFGAAAARDDGRTLFAWDAAMPFSVLLGVLFAGTIKFVVEPRQLSRFYALRDRAAIRHGLWVSTACFVVVYTLLVPLGIYARNIFPTGFQGDTDRIVPVLLTNAAVFHPAASAFIFVSLIAAAMSSVDSVLLVMASTCHRDLVSLWWKDGTHRGGVRATAAYVVLFALITAGIALDPPAGIVALTAFSGSLFAACFLPVIILGLWWRRGTRGAAIASQIVGLLVLVTWTPLGMSRNVHEVFPALLLSTLVYVALSLAARPTPSPVLDELFSANQSR